MDVDPMEYVESQDDKGKQKAADAAESRKGRLNTLIAVTVALLATFMGICKVKDDNIVQAMQQAQAKSIDHWAWYQARKIRLDFAKAAADQLRLAASTAPAASRAAYEATTALYEKDALRQRAEMKETEQLAKGFDKKYDDLNYHDDQFDLSDAALSIAIALLAVTALTNKAWLYGLAMIPTVFGFLMGLAGLFGWRIQFSSLSSLLS